MPAINSINQFVNLWECDENDHMNVQFYYAKFDDAGLVFLALSGLDGELGTHRMRHVRYHAEMRGGAQISIHSSLVSSSKDGTLIQHIMTDSQTGTLTATALDHYPQETKGDYKRYQHAMDPRAQSCSLTHEFDDRPITLAMREEQGVAAPLRGVVGSVYCDQNGETRDQAYIAFVSDAASHVWDLVGLGTGWLDERGFGRVAVEMRLSIRQPLQLGDLFELRTSFIGLRSKSFSKRYDIFNLKTGELSASVEATAMILNHETRRSEALPDFARDAIKARLIES